MSATSIALALIIACAVIVVCVVVLYITRVRRIASRVGSFQCLYRPDIQSGWTSGIAVYGANRLDWYRLVSWSYKPDRSWERADMSVTHFGDNGASGDKKLISVEIKAGLYKAHLAMTPSDYSGLVSWAEAAPPTPYGVVSI